MMCYLILYLINVLGIKEQVKKMLLGLIVLNQKTLCVNTDTRYISTHIL